MYLLHVIPVLEAGLEHPLLEDTNHHVHVEALPLHPPEGLLDGNQWGAVSHRAAALLHLGLDAVYGLGHLLQQLRLLTNSTGGNSQMLLGLGQSLFSKQILRGLNTTSSCYLSYLSVICELGLQLDVDVPLATSNLFKSFLDLLLQLS